MLLVARFSGSVAGLPGIGRGISRPFSLSKLCCLWVIVGLVIGITGLC